MDKKTSLLNRITATIIISVGVLFGLVANCLANTIYQSDSDVEHYYSVAGGGTAQQYFEPGISGKLCSITVFLSSNSGSQNVNVYLKSWSSHSDWDNGINASVYTPYNAGHTSELVLSVNGENTYTMDFTHYLYGASYYDDCITLNPSLIYSINVVFSSAGKIYGSSDANSFVNGYSRNYHFASTDPKDNYFILANDEIPYEAPTVSITYPVDESTTQAEYWAVDADTNDYTAATSTDEIQLVVRYAKSAHCAENACHDTPGYEDSIYSTKEVAACDNASSTYDGSTNLSQFAILENGATYYARAYIVGYSAEECAQTIPNEYIIGQSETIYFVYNSDYLANLDDSDTFWENGWAGMWGSATSTPGYTYGKNMIDVVIKPFLNIASIWSAIFHPEQATDWGLKAGQNVKTMFQKIGGFFNIVPQFQLFTVLLVAILFDLAIFFIRLFFKARKLLPK